MFCHPATMGSQDTSMTSAEKIITMIHEGQRFTATYTVDSGIVNVMMRREDGSFAGTSTFFDGSTSESVAKSLFCELLRDIGIY
jgi:hypothetical protein